MRLLNSIAIILVLSVIMPLLSEAQVNPPVEEENVKSGIITVRKIKPSELDTTIVSDLSFDSTLVVLGGNRVVYTVNINDVRELPQFKGDRPAFLAYVNRFVKYPAIAKKKGVNASINFSILVSGKKANLEYINAKFENSPSKDIEDRIEQKLVNRAERMAKRSAKKFLVGQDTRFVVNLIYKR